MGPAYSGSCLHAPAVLAGLPGSVCTEVPESAMPQAVPTSLPQMGTVSRPTHHALPASLGALMFPSSLSSSPLNLPSGSCTGHCGCSFSWPPTPIPSPALSWARCTLIGLNDSGYLRVSICAFINLSSFSSYSSKELRSPNKCLLNEKRKRNGFWR